MTNTTKSKTRPQKETEEKHGLPYKIAKTVYMDSSWICMGMFLELSGPTLQDLKYRVSANYEEVSRALIGRSIGYFVGAFFGGYLCDRFKRYVDLLTALALLVGTVGTFLAPYSSSVELLLAMFALQGLAEGTLAIIGNAMFIRVWREKASAPIHSLHFSYGVGAFFAPIIARQFLAPSIDVTVMQNADNDTCLKCTNTYGLLPTTGDINETLWASYRNNSTNVTTTLTAFELSKIEYSYIIVACVSIAMLLVALAFQFHASCVGPKPQSEKISFMDIFSPGSCAQGDKAFGLAVLVLIFLFYFFLVGCDHTASKLLYSYSRDTPNQFSVGDATLLNSVYWGSYSIGRGLPIFFVEWIPVTYLIIGELIGNLAAIVVLSIFAASNPMVLWVCASAYGAFMGPIFASIVTWSGHYVEVTGMVMAVIYVGSATGAFAVQWVAGYFFEYTGPHTLMYVLLVCSVAYAGVFVCLQIMASRHGDILSRTANETSDDGDIELKEKQPLGENL